jgi:hypothetical protein
LLKGGGPGAQRGLSGLTSEKQDDRTRKENRPKTALISEKTALKEVSHGSITNLMNEIILLISYSPRIWQENRLETDENTGRAGRLDDCSRKLQDLGDKLCNNKISFFR